LESSVLSVDLAYTFHLNPEKECGFQIKDGAPFLKNMDKHELVLGKNIAQVISEGRSIKKGTIDLLILDTTHYLPGELLDFIVCFPYLSENAVIVCDDLTFAHWGENKNAVATKVLFDTVVADKLFPQLDGYPKMGAFQINADTRKYFMDLFSACVSPWEYRMDKEHLSPYINLVKENFGLEENNVFKGAVEINEDSLRKHEKIHIEIEKILELCETDKQVVIYGAGSRGKALYNFLQDRGKGVYGFVVSDERKREEYDRDGRKIMALSDIRECVDEYRIILAAAYNEIKLNLDRESILYYEAPNYIFPFIKDYNNYLLSNATNL